MPVSKIRERCCQQCGINYTLGVESTQHKYCSIKCNQGLGLFEDNTTSLRKAIEYLENQSN